MHFVLIFLLFLINLGRGKGFNAYSTAWKKVFQRVETHDYHFIVSLILSDHRRTDLVLYETFENGWDESLVSGYLKGDRASTASGYLDELHHFVGRVFLNGALYHVEPALRYFTDPEFDSVLYLGNQKPFILSQMVQKLEPPDQGNVRVKRGREQKRRSLGSLKNRTCVVLLAADHLFFKHIGKNSRATTTKELLLHLYEANKIFRSTDFDFDGRSDNIGFAVGNVTIFESENMAENKFYGEITSSSDYLVRWSEYDHSGYCLALSFTYRDFAAGVLGLAYVGAKDRTGGICDQRYSVNGHKASFNTGIVSMMNFGAYVGHDVSFIILAHELGHNFGASHDPDTKLCSPGSKSGGNYIMYDKATNGDLPHNNVLSLCSRQAILEVLLTPSKTSCFRKADSYCGNGIKEWDEECDCGNCDSCPDIDPCCTPADSLTGTPCTVRREGGFQCSAVAGECCTSSCMFSGNFTLCHEERECSRQVLCSGESGDCGPSASKGLLTLCNEGQNTCDGDGRCQGSVCSLEGLEECQCLRDEYLCDVCCVDRTLRTCTSTRNLPNFNHTFLGPGQACLDYSGYCDKNHKCVTVSLDDPLSSLEDVFSERSFASAIRWIKEHWYYSLSGLAAFITLILMFKYTYVRRVPIGRALTRVKSTVLSEPAADQLQLAYSAQSDLLTKRHKPMLLEVAIERLGILFPTAELDVITDNACVAATEEIAVKRLLALDYPMSRLAVTQPAEDTEDTIQ